MRLSLTKRMNMQKRKNTILIIITLVLLVLVAIGCSSEPEPEEKHESNLGKIGHLTMKRHIDTAYTYGLSVEADGVFGATRYYLYCSKTNDPKTATIILDKENNTLSTDLNRRTTSGTYYFWYRAGNGTDYTDFSNCVSLSF